MDLNSVETGLDGVLGGLSVKLNVLLNLVLGESSWLGSALERNIARRDDVVALGLEVAGIGSAAECPQLHEDLAALGVDRLGDLLPSIDMCLVVDVWDAWVASGLWCDDGGLGNEESAWNLGALSIVLGHHWEWDVVLIAAEAGERSEGNAVLKLGAANLDWLEELGGGGGGGHRR